MAGSEHLEPEAARPLEELPELDVPVALDAGIGCPPLRVSGHIGIDDGVFELLDEVKGVVIETELLCHAPRVVHVGDGAASRVRGPAPELQGDADDFVTLFGQERSRDR
jgi:hypothetical protein